MEKGSQLYLELRRSPQLSKPAADRAIAYLEADTYKPGSGNVKELAWRRLRNSDLTAGQHAQLRAVARAYLHRRMGREFWQMCVTVARVADEPFRREVNALAATAPEPVRTRAVLLGAHLESLERGTAVRKRFQQWAQDRRFGWTTKPFAVATTPN